MYLKGRSRRGPTFREAILMHAVARVVFHGLIDNIQASWVKMGREGIAACLQAGVNDLGGTLMNESITRAAGSGHGQEWEPRLLEAQIRAAGRQPRMRTTLYAEVSAEQRAKALTANPLGAVANQAAGKQQRSKRIDLVDATSSAIESGGYAGPQAQVVLMAACN
jgi:FO synthase